MKGVKDDKEDEVCCWLPGVNGAAEAASDRFSDVVGCERRTENDKAELMLEGPRAESVIGAGIARWVEFIGVSGSRGEPGGGDWLVGNLS